MNGLDNALHDEMRAWRHDIHKHPELGFAEARTAATVTGLLEGFGLVVHPGIGTTGVVAFCAVAARTGPSACAPMVCSHFRYQSLC